MNKVLPDCLRSRLYGSLSNMATTVALVGIFVVWYLGRRLGENRGRAQAEEEERRQKQAPEYTSRGGPRDPIHDVMID